MAMRNWLRRTWRLRPSGYAFALTAVLVQLAAWNTGTNLYYVVAGALASFLAMAFMLSGVPLAGLRVVRESPAYANRDAPFSVTIHLANGKKRLPAMSVHLVGRFKSEKGEPSAQEAYVAKIPAQGELSIRMAHTFHRRGVHSLPPLLVHSAFPFGLISRQREVGDATEIVVHPRVRAVRTGVMEQMEGTGETRKNMAGEGDEFHSLRDYVPGDDLRHISWRVSARVGRLVTRELEPSTARNVYVVLDTALAANVEDFHDLFEEAVELAASLAISFLNSQYAVSLVTPSDTVPLGEGNAHGRHILDRLARVEATEGPEPENWYVPHEDLHGAGFVFLSPDPGKWRSPAGFRGARFLDPREVVRA